MMPMHALHAWAPETTIANFRLVSVRLALLGRVPETFLLFPPFMKLTESPPY